MFLRRGSQRAAGLRFAHRPILGYSQRHFASEQKPSGLHDTIDPIKATGTLRQFRDFDLEGKVFAITGGGRGLGLSMAEILAEAGGRGKLRDAELSGIP